MYLIKELLARLEAMPPGVERDYELFAWKHANWPERKIFSTQHGGDCAGNLLKVLAGELFWPEKGEVDGKMVILELEKNFNEFVTWLKQQLTN